MRLRHPLLAILAVLMVALGLANFMLATSGPSGLGGLSPLSLFITHPLAILAGGYLLFVWVFPRAIGPTHPGTARRVEAVRASGPEGASTVCAARLGHLRFRGPLLRVAVHPGGIVFRPLLMAPRAILASEIAAAEVRRGFFNRALVIRHSGPDIGETVALYIGEDHPVTQAICSLLPPDAR